MRIYKYLFFLATLAFTACVSEVVIPADIIQPDRMANICAEIHQIDGTLMTVNQTPDSLYYKGMGTYVVMFKKYGTDTADFRKSYLWYTRHPKKLDEVYVNVQAIIQKRVDSLTKVPAPPAPKQGANPQPANPPQAGEAAPQAAAPANDSQPKK